MVNKVSIGLLGLGVVGSGVVHIINNHQEKLKHQLGVPVEVKRVLVRNLEKAREVDVDPTLLTVNPDDVLNDPEIDVIIEVMGGVDIAKDYILKAFSAKKHVVSANKDLVALHGPELHAAAENNKCDFYYEASVAGGIPILRGITDGLASDRIERVMGIVNGTTNYILTKMAEEGTSYEDALKQAQDLGFAEADPTADVEGLDAATEKGLCWAGGFNEDEDDMYSWLLRLYPDRSFSTDEEKLRMYTNAFTNYFSGESKTFDIPLDLQGTPFQLAVWDALQRIPYGETKTYSAIADSIGNPKSVRAVGTAIGRNPVLIAVPCHRVIQKNGTLGGFRAGLQLKEALLNLEQV